MPTRLPIGGWTPPTPGSLLPPVSPITGLPLPTGGWPGPASPPPSGTPFSSFVVPQTTGLPLPIGGWTPPTPGSLLPPPPPPPPAPTPPPPAPTPPPPAPTPPPPAPTPPPPPPGPSGPTQEEIAHQIAAAIAAERARQEAAAHAAAQAQREAAARAQQEATARGEARLRAEDIWDRMHEQRAYDPDGWQSMGHQADAISMPDSWWNNGEGWIRPSDNALAPDAPPAAEVTPAPPPAAPPAPPPAAPPPAAPPSGKPQPSDGEWVMTQEGEPQWVPGPSGSGPPASNPVGPLNPVGPAAAPLASLQNWRDTSRDPPPGWVLTPTGLQRVPAAGLAQAPSGLPPPPANWRDTSRDPPPGWVLTPTGLQRVPAAGWGQARSTGTAPPPTAGGTPIPTSYSQRPGGATQPHSPDIQAALDLHGWNDGSPRPMPAGVAQWSPGQPHGPAPGPNAHPEMLRSGAPNALAQGNWAKPAAQVGWGSWGKGPSITQTPTMAAWAPAGNGSAPAPTRPTVSGWAQAPAGNGSAPTGYQNPEQGWRGPRKWGQKSAGTWGSGTV
jgi:hypothetical protein